MPLTMEFWFWDFRGKKMFKLTKKIKNRLGRRPFFIVFFEKKISRNFKEIFTKCTYFEKNIAICKNRSIFIPIWIPSVSWSGLQIWRGLQKKGIRILLGLQKIRWDSGGITKNEAKSCWDSIGILKKIMIGLHMDSKKSY